MSTLKKNKGSVPITTTSNTANRTCGLLWNKTSREGEEFVSGMLLINEEFFKRLQFAKTDEKGNKVIYINLREVKEKVSDKTPDYKLVLRNMEE